MINSSQNPKIVVSGKTKKELDSLKIHHRETYEDVIIRLITNEKKK